MREINLIDKLSYNFKYREIREIEGKKYYDGDNYSSDQIDLTKKVYKADELVNINNEINIAVNDIKNSFIDTFNNRGGATKEQINFAEETAKIVFGDLKENITIGIPAPCGFGKSSISLEILKKLIQLIKNNKTTDGLILVTDRLDSLRDTQNDLKDIGLDGYTYILEGWNGNICNNKKVTQAESKICTPKKCPYFYDCKIYEQQEEQNKYPILMITNARLRECGDSIKQYSTYENGDRKILLIDERPDVLNTIKVSKSLLNEISTEISKCEYEDTAEKTKFENMFRGIQNNLIDKMQKLRKKYKRFIISNINNEPICKNDDEFMELWDKYMKNNYKRELEHINTVLTFGGFYVYEKHTEFISTIGSRNLKEMYSDTFKTIVFDGTALYDPLYLGMYDNESIKFLDVENTRLYNNLHVKAYIQHKLTKQTFRDKNYLAKACANFVKDRMKTGFNNKGYVVSYKEQSVNLAKFINNTLKCEVAKLSEDECHYFGNTKGKNSMKNCNIMFQFGWDTMPDYEYVIQWLSTSVKWEDTIKYCSDLEKAENLSDELVTKDRSKTVYNGTTYASSYKSYEFGLQRLNQFKMFSIVTNFYQEVHRIKLRNYNCTEEIIEVNVFSQKRIILDMIEQLFPKCKLKLMKDVLNCFVESKVDGRKNGDKAKILKDFIENDWKINEVLKIKDLAQKTNLTKNDIDNLKRKNNYFTKLFDKYKTDKNGTYKKIS